MLFCFWPARACDFCLIKSFTTVRSSASRPFALPQPLKPVLCFCLSAQALALLLPRCWVHIISAPPRLNAHLVFAVSFRVFAPLPLRHTIRFTAFAAHIAANLYRCPSSRRCPFLRHTVACHYDAILCLCLSSLCRSWRRLCRSIPATSLPMRCPSSLCLCASVLGHASAYPLNADPGLCRSYRRCAYPQPFVSDLIPAAAALRSSMSSPCICSLCLSFSARLSPLHCRRFALHIGPSLRRRWADLSNAAASLVFATALPRWALPLPRRSSLCPSPRKSVLRIAFAPLISSSPSPCYPVPVPCYSARISAAAVRFRAWLFSAAAVHFRTLPCDAAAVQNVSVPPRVAAMLIASFPPLFMAFQLSAVAVRGVPVLCRRRSIRCTSWPLLPVPALC